MHKEAVTGRTIIDDDFLKIELKPPKKMKVIDASKETVKLWREIDRLLYGLNKKNYKKKEFSSRGFSGRKQLCTVKMYYGNTKEDAAEIGFRDDFIYSFINLLSKNEQNSDILSLEAMNKDITSEEFNLFKNKEDKSIY